MPLTQNPDTASPSFEMILRRCKHHLLVGLKQADTEKPGHVAQ